MAKTHPLEKLEEQRLGPYAIGLEKTPARNFEQVYFTLWLENEKGEKSTPVVKGLFSAGRPNENIAGWFDVVFSWRPRLDEEEIDLSQDGLDAELFKQLALLVPPGGSLMAAYDAPAFEAPLLEETRRGLAQEVPPQATPLGHLMFRAGCGHSVRDWYISEGGNEGPRKLQGFKPLNAQHQAVRAAQLKETLEQFLKNKATHALQERAQARARKILAILQ